ncbi:MAG: HesA/MoeB/ThiF family protein [Saprospiraceae bacterium]|nr:HesA/MoeB/ThiF family protein [Saprospiraceae bacterium]
MNNKRYIRQTLLNKFGEVGQERLIAAHVVVVGCGGLGSIAAPYLAGAGVGKLTLVDGDIPHVSNLHRQVFFKTEQTKSTKSEELARHIVELNPEIEVRVVAEMLRKDTMADVLQDANVVLECTDNIQVKYMVNDFCALLHIPMVYGAIHKYDGYVSFFENMDASSIHLRDIFAEPNDDIPSCSEVGVMGTLAGVIGLMQANEAIKYISGAGECLQGVLLTYGILGNDQMKLKLKKTYHEDLQKVYESSTYIAEQVCASYEVTLGEVLQNREVFQVISILEDHEHEAIDNSVDRIPLSTFEVNQWQEEQNKRTVFYCMSGMRSGKLVNEILSVNPTSQVFSLAGGLKYFKSSSKHKSEF